MGGDTSTIGNPPISFIYTTKSPIQNLRTQAVAIYEICDIKYLLGMWA